MKTKMLEIRDIHTFIPVMATQLKPTDKDDWYLLRRSGFGKSQLLDGVFVLVSKIAHHSVQSSFYPYDWPDSDYSRTMRIAHEYITKNFDTLLDGAVIDVEYIMGETSEPKASERHLNDLT